jgi:hypothetical protein
MQSTNPNKVALAAICKAQVEAFVQGGGQIKYIKPRGVKRSERTYDPHKSKYSSWNQGVGNMSRGRRGVTGTVG